MFEQWKFIRKQNNILSNVIPNENSYVRDVWLFFKKASTNVVLLVNVLLPETSFILASILSLALDIDLD